MRLILISALLSLTAAGELKVDINRDSKDLDAYTEIGYQKWSQGIASSTTSNGTTPITRHFTTDSGETVTISFAQTPGSANAGGTGLTFIYNASHLSGTLDLLGDGLTVAPSQLATGGEIQMTLSGLSAGTHTLLTFHNGCDNAWSEGSLAPLNLSINGTPALGPIAQSVKATSNAMAGSSYLTFHVSDPSDVTTILFSADTATGDYPIRNPMINGFEIDTPNLYQTAHNPSPADGDAHVDADHGTLTLRWEPALSGDVLSHHLYLGTDRAAVKTATIDSPLFLGNLSDSTDSFSPTLAPVTYFWRVDEIHANGTITPGTVWSFRRRRLAFPGAEGYGRFAWGGRGGNIVHVTSLDDYSSGEEPIPGTLRYAIQEESGPRIILFDVGGLITVKERLTLNDDFVTLAGQTAPGKGICLRQWPLGLSGSDDTIVRFLRNRPGDISGATVDGGGLAGCDHSIMDHCSISWSIDEAFSGRGAKNITLQNSLISEALAIAGHQNYPAGTDHGYAATIGGDTASYHHNLLAHCSGRNWSMGGGLDAQNRFAGRLDIRNNVIYNWKSRTTDGGAMEVNFIGNYYKPGAATIFTPFALTMNHEDLFGGSQQCFFSGNIMEGYFDESNQSIGRRSVVDSGIPTPSYDTFVTTPFFDGISLISEQSATAAFKRVLSDSGANRPLDDHDSRIIQETIDGTTSVTGKGPYGGAPGLPNSQEDVGGWEDYPTTERPPGWDHDRDGLPDWWETLHGSNPSSAHGDFSDAHADLDGDGQTVLDDYLHFLASVHTRCLTGNSVEIDLALHTRGYTDTPRYTFSNLLNCTAVWLPDTSIARITPSLDFIGIASLTVTVTDASGDSHSLPVQIRVAPEFPLSHTRLEIRHQIDRLELLATAPEGTPVSLQESTTLDHWITAESFLGNDATRVIARPTPFPGERSFFRLHSED
ncbi:hypothetical protein HNR46_003902 [Haloferula luteola]|uniref:Pectate lyase n=1 Tax=Haloferula luteola TaxID=595692 RepID=A0A840VLY8_9BACT|nr:T9SS C-terminal target domain-containing protein [Haloferula luteola]MBB5353641.1 hypothetical protein [Haloferula luteola]